MAPRKGKQTKAPLIGYGYWDERQTIRECKNLVRWNAPLAIQFMEHAAGRVCTMNSLIIKEYNKAVDCINNYLDMLERQRYYNKQEIWGHITPQRLEELFEPLDDFSLYETAAQINENLD